jgi:anti-sigma factor RsiW
MNSQLSSRDWEYLSAYLDRQLKPKEIASLEARLSVDPVLSAALGELQRTRDALRSLPRMRAPRNFTLTPQMVDQRSSLRQRSPLRARPAARLAPVFGFASALATFLLVLVIAGDFLGILAPSTKPLAQAPVLSSEVAVQPMATAVVEERIASKEAAPTEPQQPETAAAEDTTMLQAPQTAQMITGTADLSLTAEAGEPTERMILTEEPPAMPGMITETETVTLAMTETTSAKQASGMGGGMVSGTDENLPVESAILTSEGLMWNSTITLTVSPTETLMFPMTVTMAGPGITMTSEAGVGGGPPEEQPPQPLEPTFTAIPEESPAQSEPSSPVEHPDATELNAPAPTETPEIVALAIETPTTPLRELQSMNRAAAPTSTLTPPLPTPQSARTSQTAVRVIEIALAILAFVTGLAALYTWWMRRM